LTLIAGPVEQVLQHGKLNDEEREQLVLVERNTNRMLRLVNQIGLPQDTEQEDEDEGATD
jgi:hypothetical protein